MSIACLRVLHQNVSSDGRREVVEGVGRIRKLSDWSQGDRGGKQHRVGTDSKMLTLLVKGACVYIEGDLLAQRRGIHGYPIPRLQDPQILFGRRSTNIL